MPASGGIQVLRMEVRATLDANLHQHVLGNIRPDTARAVRERSVVFHDDLPGAQAALAAALDRRTQRKTRGPKPAHAVDFVLTGPPGYEEENAWPEETARAWARECVDWVRELCGPNTVVSGAAMHRDESSPHVHVLVVPIDSEGTLAWKRVCMEANARIRGQRPGPKRKMGDWYRTFQDDLHERVSARYGLERGQRGSSATHQAIDRQRAAERGVEIAQKQATRVLREAGEAAAQATAGDRALGKAVAGEDDPQAQAGRQERARLEAKARQAEEKAKATVQAVRQAASAEIARLRQALQAAQDEARAAREAVKAKAASAKALATQWQAHHDKVKAELQAAQDETGRVQGILDATRARAEQAEEKVRSTIEAAKALDQQAQARIAGMQAQLAAAGLAPAGPSVSA